MPKRKNGTASGVRAKKVKVGRKLRSMASRAVHTHVKFVKTTTVGSAGGNPFTGSISSTLSGFAGSAELAALYDQYRIDQLELTFYLKVSPEAQAATAATYPKLWWSDDADDGATITQAAMLERANAQVHVLDPANPIRKTVKPSVLKNLYINGTAVGSSPEKGVWIDMTYTNVPHFGAQFNVEDFTNTNYQLDIVYKATISCKSSR